MQTHAVVPMDVSSGLTSRPSLSEHGLQERRRAIRVSSGLISRPSLSAHQTRPQQQPAVRVSSGLTSRPSLSVRSAVEGGGSRGRVVGINLPTFVERLDARRGPRSRWPVSSGLTSRPSLSGRQPAGQGRCRPRVVGINLPTFVERHSGDVTVDDVMRVVGINLPTFVERRRAAGSRCRPARVSSGLSSRPSLSAPPRLRPGARRQAVSSGLTSRPSLSAAPAHPKPPLRRAVSSGLTSRPSLSVARHRTAADGRNGVVGINLPTFVERMNAKATLGGAWCVSSGLTSRPSLSEDGRRQWGLRRHVSSGLTSRPSLSGAGRPAGAGIQAGVVGINLPTFVERRARWRTSTTPRSCRRD